MVAYFTPGTFDVTLEVSDGTETVSLTLEDYITVSPSPGQASLPEGETNVCTNPPYIVPNDYTTTGAPDAESYVWELTPADAGTISGTGTTATVNWTEYWEGTVSIKVKGVNDCGEGIFSEELAVDCGLCTGISNDMLKKSVQIFPNPATGNVNIRIDNSPGEVEIAIVNVLNESLIHISETITSEKTINVDLSEFSSGLYFVRIKTATAEIIEKMVLRD
jgi:PKD repeat protein